jgi:hypothetical protein
MTSRRPDRTRDGVDAKQAFSNLTRRKDWTNILWTNLN